MIRALGAAFPVSARSLHIAVGLGAIAFLVLLVRSAWISDDAAISLRTVLNVTHGFGLTFNIAERVQTFTHPLWLLLLVAAYLVIGNLFVATIALSVVVSVAAFWLLLVRAATPLQAGVAAAALVFSRAFVDFSVSGLENPLLNLLLAVFLLAYLAPLSDRGRWLVRLWILASLVYLTRPDGVLFVAPLLLVACVKVRSAAAIARAVAIGVIPAVAWTVFSLIYYGFPFPNTAYAKLATGINGGELRQQGFVYLVDSLDRDPLTITAIGFALVFTLLTRTLTAIAWAAGIVLYLVHVVWIGGDFMAGRFLAAPFFASVLLMSWLAISRREVLLPAIGLAVLVGATAPEPPLWRVAAATNPDIRPSGIVDERAIYFMHRSLVRSTRQRLRDPSWPIDTGARPSLRVVETCGLMGQGGLDLGPYVHLLDVCALADPLLARLPAVYNDDWRPGHYRRMVPGGYAQSLEGSSNLLTDPGLHAYYEQLRLVTRSRPLFSRERLTAIFRINMGRYDNQIDRTFYRHEGSVTRLRAIGQVKETGEPSTGEGVRSLETSLAVLCDEISGRRQIDISLDSDDRYELIFLNGTRRIDQVEISSVPEHRRPAGLMRHTIDVPPRALQRGFDMIVISAVAGDDPPAIGHLLVK